MVLPSGPVAVARFTLHDFCPQKGSINKQRVPRMRQRVIYKGRITCWLSYFHAKFRYLKDLQILPRTVPLRKLYKRFGSQKPVRVSFH